MVGNVYECNAGAARAPLLVGYQRREPEKTVLYQLVAEELATFREETFAFGGGMGIPEYVFDEFERYLSCGILCNGFARLKCAKCGEESLVGFSCKGRGICPSCGTRRMHDTAAHLVDRVLPIIPYRQWVLSYPKWLRPLLAKDPGLWSRAQNIFLASIFVWQRKQARAIGLSGKIGVGAVSFSQRFGDSLNLNPHIHAIIP